MDIIEVCDDRILFEQHEGQSTIGKVKIIVPGTVYANENTGLQKGITTAKILKTGERCSVYKAGDQILFGKDSSAFVELGNKKYGIIREEEICFSFEGNEVKEVNEDRILIEPYSRERITESGIIIPENVSDRPDTGKVIAVGFKVSKVKQGDAVLFGAAAGREIEFCGKKYIIIRYADVVMTLGV